MERKRIEFPGTPLQKKDPGTFKRALRPTPPFFRKIRRIGMALLTVSAAIGAVASGGLLVPAAISAAAGYMAAAGAATVAVSQLAVDPE